MTARQASRLQPPPVDHASRDVTELLSAWRDGDAEAGEELLAHIYPRLRALAARQIARTNGDVSISATELVNELYLKLVGKRQPDYENRLHFFGISARLMRDILVDRVRRRRSQKRGSGTVLLELGAAASTAVDTHPPADLLSLNDSLDRLEEVSSVAVRVVELKFFAGLNLDETAAVLDISRSTVVRTWRYARAWLRRELGGAAGGA